MELTIKITWDPEACVWTADGGGDVPGLTLESGSVDALIERLRYAVPELLELNGKPAGPLTLRMVSERCEKVAG